MSTRFAVFHFSTKTLTYFDENPILTPDGIPVEKGAVRLRFDKTYRLPVKEYYMFVDFIQKFNVNERVKTVISGTIKFMTGIFTVFRVSFATILPLDCDNETF